MDIIINIVCGLFFLSELTLLVVKRSKSSDSTQKQDKLSLWIVWGTIIVSMIVANYVAHVYLTDYIEWLKWAGIGIFFVGMAIRMTAIYQLGKAFTVDVAVSSTQKIKDDGLYKNIRHPAYTGVFLEFFGVSLMFGNWYTLLIVNIPVLLAMMYRIKIEEAALTQHFGPAYAEYMKRTKRIIPFIL